MPWVIQIFLPASPSAFSQHQLLRTVVSQGFQKVPWKLGHINGCLLWIKPGPCLLPLISPISDWSLTFPSHKLPALNWRSVEGWVSGSQSTARRPRGAKKEGPPVEPSQILVSPEQRWASGRDRLSVPWRQRFPLSWDSPVKLIKCLVLSWTVLDVISFLIP